MKEIGDFVVMNDELERDHDAFKLDLKNSIYIPETDIVHSFFEVEGGKSDVIQKFGKVYFKLSQERVDALYSWMKEINDSDYSECDVSEAIVAPTIRYDS